MVEKTSLDNAVSIVTGGGGDIGTGIAAELAAAGSDVVIVDVDVIESEYNQQASTEMDGVGRAQEAVDRVEAEGQRAHVVDCDVTKADQVEAMVDEVVEEFGGIDIVSNNAGVITVSPVEEMDEAEWDSIIDEPVIESLTCEAAGFGDSVYKPQSPAKRSFGRRVLECSGYRDGSAV